MSGHHKTLVAGSSDVGGDSSDPSGTSKSVGEDTQVDAYDCGRYRKNPCGYSHGPHVHGNILTHGESHWMATSVVTVATPVDTARTPAPMTGSLSVETLNVEVFTGSILVLADEVLGFPDGGAAEADTANAGGTVSQVVILLRTTRVEVQARVFLV